MLCPLSPWCSVSCGFFALQHQLFAADLCVPLACFVHHLSQARNIWLWISADVSPVKNLCVFCLMFSCLKNLVSLRLSFSAVLAYNPVWEWGSLCCCFPSGYPWDFSLAMNLHCTCWQLFMSLGYLALGIQLHGAQSQVFSRWCSKVLLCCLFSLCAASEATGSSQLLQREWFRNNGKN